MALATTIVGDGILISLTTSKRQWGIWSVEMWQSYTETQSEEVREWVALTEAIAKSTAETATQPTAPAVATYVASEDNRTVGAYKLTVTTTETTVTQDP